MGGSFAIEMPGHRYLTFAETSADVTQEMAGALDELATAARSVATSLAASLESDVASTRAVYDQSARALEPLHGAITRVIMLGDEPDLVKRMLALERALRVWGTWVTEVEHAGAPDSIAWEQAISALETGTEVYKYFVAQMESSLPPPGPARKDPWDSGPELIACSALMGVLPFMLWSGGEVASGLFGFASRWRTVVFIAAAAVSLSGFAVLQDRPDDDLLPRAILLGAWLLLVFVIEPVLGLGLSAEAALKAYGIALLLILSCFVVLAPGSFLRYTPSWLLAWGGLCALFAYLAHRLVLYQ